MNPSRSQQELILSALYQLNPWWGARYLGEEYKRIILDEVQAMLAAVAPRRAVLLDGPRRAGKTTILYQLADAQVRRKNLVPESILYVSFDHPVFEGGPMNQILDIHKNRVLRGAAPSMYLLDELHYTAN